MHITLVGRDLVDFELYYGLYILGFRYTISESATPGKRQAQAAPQCGRMGLVASAKRAVGHFRWSTVGLSS